MAQRPVLIAPSLLAANFARLADEVSAVEAAGADWLHLDVMDGHFVPNISFGPVVLRALRPLTRLPFDVHLTIAGLGCKAGLALNPATPALPAAPGLDLVDIILVMSVNPGFGGQKFLHSQLEKIAELRRMIDASGRDIRLEVDGGVDAHTAPSCIAAGADTFVAGTAVFATPDYAAAIASIRGNPAS